MPPRKSATKTKRKVKAEGIAPTVIAKAERTAPKELAAFQFKKGMSGNPSGRPKGSRNKLDEVFVAALYEAFETGGADAIKRVMQDDPTAFLNVVAKVLPKHVETKVKVSIEELGDDELANIAAGGRQRAAAAKANTPQFH